MRRPLCFFVFFMLIVPAWGDEASKMDASQPHRARQTWQQRFGQANLARDGHLTLDEARAGYTWVARHFNAIDVDHKGYVTENDVRAWRILQKEARRRAKPPDSVLKPRHAFLLRSTGQGPAIPQQRVALPGKLTAAVGVE